MWPSPTSWAARPPAHKASRLSHGGAHNRSSSVAVRSCSDSRVRRRWISNRQRRAHGASRRPSRSTSPSPTPAGSWEVWMRLIPWSGSPTKAHGPSRRSTQRARVQRPDVEVGAEATGRAHPTQAMVPRDRRRSGMKRRGGMALDTASPAPSRAAPFLPHEWRARATGQRLYQSSHSPVSPSAGRRVVDA